MPIIYLSPSTQENNLYVTGGTEEQYMNLLADKMIPYLDASGIRYVRNTPEMNAVSSIAASNAGNYDLHLALHSNAGGGGKAYGPVALYYSQTGKDFCQKLVNALLALGQKTNRSSHVTQQKSLYELRKTKAPAALLEVDFHDSSAGVEFITRRRTQIAEAIAKVIIEADGRAFVPAGPQESLEEAVRLGLFGENTCWDEPVVRRELAHLALRLRQILGGG